jgi:hypothetical protein
MRGILLLLPLGSALLLASCTTTNTSTNTGTTPGKKKTSAHRASSRTAKPATFQGRVLTGLTEYYRPGYRAPAPVTSQSASSKSRRPSWLTRAKTQTDTSSRSSSASEGPSFISSTKSRLRSLLPAPAQTSSSGATHTDGTTFANPDGTTSRIVGSAMIRSDGTKDWIIGNTVFHSNGTKSRIVGDTLINPDGTKSRKVK